MEGNMKKSQQYQAELETSTLMTESKNHYVKSVLRLVFLIPELTCYLRVKMRGVLTWPF